MAFFLFIIRLCTLPNLRETQGKPRLRNDFAQLLSGDERRKMLWIVLRLRFAGQKRDRAIGSAERQSGVSAWAGRA
jgi:hypothetical protein